MFLPLFSKKKEQTMPVYPTNILTQVSLGTPTNIWGVDASNNIYQYNGSVWTRIAGTLKQVSAAPDGTVWGVAPDGAVYRYAGNNTWTKMPGTLKQVSVGSSSNIWGVSPINQTFIYDQGTWVKVADGTITQICVEQQQGPPVIAAAYGLTPQGGLSRCSYYQGKASWDTITTGSPRFVSMSTVGTNPGSSGIFVIDSGGVAYQYVSGGTGLVNLQVGNKSLPLVRSFASALDMKTSVFLDMQGQTQQSPPSAGWNTTVEGTAENSPTFPFQNNAVLALQGANGLYLGPFNRNGNMPIEAVKDSSADIWAQFSIAILSSNQIALKSAGNGLYLGLVARDGKMPIEAAKGSSNDVYAQFTVTLLPNNKIALQANNGLYLGPFDRNGKMPIEAVKDSSADIWAQFTWTSIN
jgi:hypothetical protein